MNDQIKNGGPAFPCPDSNSLGHVECSVTGMTLRDYFAAKAMQALIGTAGAPCLGGLDGYESQTAKAAYRMSDAMLAARGDA
jgi:hypothetical protein